MNEAEQLRVLGRRHGLSQPISWVAESPSTNHDLRAMADAGAPHGTGLLARSQTSGRGRMGRTWQAPPGRNLTLSVLLRPQLAPADLPMVVLAAGVAAVEAAGAGCGLKWPNDLLSASGLKVGGILAEAEFQGKTLEYVIVGLGLNLTWSPPELPATDLQALGGESDPLTVGVRWTASLLGWVERAQRDRPALLAAYRGADVTIGRRVVVGELAGEAVGIDNDGALRIRCADGCERRIVAGDVEMVG